MLSRALQQYEAALHSDALTIFDRGIPDLIAYSQCFDLASGAEMRAAELYRYNQKVFFAPSWAEIFKNDDERKLTFDQTCDFGENLRVAYQQLGYKLVELPYDTLIKRVEFILDILNRGG